jgi:hypothetical protein
MTTLKNLLEGLEPLEIADAAIIGDGYTQRDHTPFLWNEQYRRFEFFPSGGGWFGLNEDGSWVFDMAPFAG